jgi:hypothetical protein
MKTIRILFVIAFVAVLNFHSSAQLKVTTNGTIGITTNNPNPTSITGVRMDVFGSQIISGSSNKIFFGDEQRYIGLTNTNLTIISKNNNWLNIGSNAGIAFWGGPGADINSNFNYQMFINSFGVGIGSGGVAWGVNKLVVYGGSLISGNYYQGSDIRFKKNIIEINNPLELVKKLKGKNYEYRTNEKEFEKYSFSEGRKFGFIAQELKEVLSELVTQDKEGMYFVDYNGIIPILVESIKEQQQQIEELKERINNADMLKNAQSINTHNNNSNNIVRIDQNQPNPFTTTTEIKYFTPTNCKNASINIYNLSGGQIKHIEITQKGNGFVTINAGELTAGIYIYNLIVDGKEIDTKKMILTD